MQRCIVDNYAQLCSAIPHLAVSDQEYASIARYAYGFSEDNDFAPDVTCAAMMILAKYVHCEGNVTITADLLDGCLLVAEFVVSHSLLDMGDGPESPALPAKAQEIVGRLGGNLYIPSVMSFHQVMYEGTDLEERQQALVLASLNPASRIYTPLQLSQLCVDNTPTFQALVLPITGSLTLRPITLTGMMSHSAVEPGVVTNAMIRSYSVIGQGGFGTVYKTLEGRALKIDNHSYSYLKELSVMMLMSHPNVQSAEGYSLSDYKTITMKMQMMSLDAIIGAVPRDLHHRYIHDVSRAVEALHSYGILHGDIKPGNVLVTKKGVLKLADFGSCRTFCSYKPTQSFSEMYMPEYRPPELIGDALFAMYSLKADVWAMGVLAAHIINGRNFACDLLNHTDRVDRVPNSTFALRHFVGQTLDPNPETRIGMAQGCLLLE